MKNMRALTLMCATAFIAASLPSFVSCGKAPDDTSGTQRSVKIGRQQGALRAGVGMTATFEVKTENIKDGQTGRVVWYADKQGGEEASAPAGIGNAGVTDIENNSSTVTITTTDGIAEGEYYLAVEFNERWSSGVATLTVGEEAYFTIGEQTGAVSSGQSDVEISYTLTVTNMDAAGKNITVAWFTDEEGTTSGGQPANVSAQGQTTGNVLKFTAGSGGKKTPAGTYYFRATVDGEYPSANVGTLTVFEPFFTIGAQGAWASNVNSAKTISYTLAGNGIDVAGKSVTVGWFTTEAGTTPCKQPANVSVMSQTMGNILNLTVCSGNNATTADTYWFRATIGGEYTSQNVGILKVDAATITVGAQQGILVEGTPGWVEFPVTTTNIAPGNYLDGVDMNVSNLPTSVILSQGISIGHDGKGTLRLGSPGTSHMEAVRAVSLHILGVRSNTFILTIDGAPYPMPSQNLMIQKHDFWNGTYNTMVDSCNTSTAHGYSDWRMPTFNECRILYQYRSELGLSNTSSYWAGTNAEGTLYRWINFATGNDGDTTEPDNPNIKRHVRCVRTY